MKELLKDTFVMLVIFLALAMVGFSLVARPAIATPNPTTTPIPSKTPTTADFFHIPPRYYDDDPIIPAGVSLEAWLWQKEWPIEYKENDFDCSKMTTFLEWALENSGYTARIVTGTIYDEGARYDHAWVEVKENAKWRIIETTTLKFASDSSIYHAVRRYDDIYDLAIKLCAFDKDYFDREFAWWKD
jgi:hypothetical protein